MSLKNCTIFVFGCMMFYCGMIYEYKLNVFSKAIVMTDENNNASGLELDNSFIYPKQHMSKKLIKYYEISEEDLFKLFYRFIYETIYGKRKYATEEYVSTVTKAYLEQLFYVPYPELIFYNVAKAKRESHFDIKAKPTTSSAMGFGQIIYKWHKDKLCQEYNWRTPNIPITQNMLCEDFKASVDAQYIVFESYWRNNDFNYNKATNAYFGLSHSQNEQHTYRLNLLSEYTLLTQRFMRIIFAKEPKYKLLTLCKEEIIDEKILNGNQVNEELDNL